MSAAGTRAPTDVLAAFRREAEAASSEVVELASWRDVVAHVVERAAGGRVALTTEVAREREMMAGLEEAGVEVVVPTDPREASDVAVGVVRGQLAIAESGSVVVSEHDLGDRVVAMLAVHGVQIVDRDRIVGSLDAAADWLSERAGSATYATLVTGPSRTADIERSLTIGVQGPASLDVVVLE